MKFSRVLNITVLCLLSLVAFIEPSHHAEAFFAVTRSYMPCLAKSPANCPDTSLEMNVSPGLKLALPDYPDLVVTAIWMNPNQPEPSEPFTVTVVIHNQGNSIARAFTVGAKFEPCDVVAATTVEEGLAPGRHITVELNSLVEQTTMSTVAIVVDLENLIDEGPIGERNNAAPFTYRIDYPSEVGYVESHDLQLEISNRIFATLTDTELAPSEDVLLRSFEGVSFEQVHYDLLSESNEGLMINRDELVPDAMISFSTSDGMRGILKILSFQNEMLQIEYRIYPVQAQESIDS